MINILIMRGQVVPANKRTGSSLEPLKCW